MIRTRGGPKHIDTQLIPEMPWSLVSNHVPRVDTCDRPYSESKGGLCIPFRAMHTHTNLHTPGHPLKGFCVPPSQRMHPHTPDLMKSTQLFAGFQMCAEPEICMFLAFFFFHHSKDTCCWRDGIPSTKGWPCQTAKSMLLTLYWQFQTGVPRALPSPNWLWLRFFFHPPCNSKAHYMVSTCTWWFQFFILWLNVCLW